MSSEAKSVARRLESELREVQNVVRGGEESVARLRGQLEEVQEREEATQLQLAHAIAQVKPYSCKARLPKWLREFPVCQVDKAMTERDSYSRIVSERERERVAVLSVSHCCPSGQEVAGSSEE